MNRTMRPVARAKAAKSRISSSLWPRSSTTFTFSGVSPAASAASMARRTSLRTPRRRMAAKRSGRRESQLTLTRRRPAEASFRAMPASSVPLVVTARSSNPSADSRATSTGSPLRTSGSPPVMRSAVTPRLRATRATRVISSNVRSSVLAEEREALLGHAVDAAQVAAIGDRDAKVVVHAPVAVDQWALQRHSRAPPSSRLRWGRTETATRTGAVMRATLTERTAGPGRPRRARGSRGSSPCRRSTSRASRWGRCA